MSAIAEYLATETDMNGNQYRSKTDGSYVGLRGVTDEGENSMLEFFIEHGISQLQNANGNPENSASIGFSEAEQKWYGWSHRAIYGFGIGAEVKQGDCAYKAVDEEDFLQCKVEFWADEYHKNVEGRIGKNTDNEHGVFVDWEYTDDVPNEKLRNTVGGVFQRFPEAWGKGEWKAQTLEDAKEMAIDFANAVS
jgi:hypothetical protein